MKLGIYVINCGDLPLDWFAKAQPTLVVSMDANPDYWREVKRVSPRTFILGRYYVDSQPFDSPIQNAIDFCTLMRPSALLMKGIYDAWMSYNEPAVWNQTDAENLSRFTSVWSDKMHFDGIETAAYSFSEGHPDLSLWPYLTEGIRRSNYLCLHEYDWPTMYRTQGWRCLRYRKVLKALPEDMQNTPIIIGETGIDGGVTNEQTSQPFAPVTGWNGTGDVQHYIESLSWYNSEISRDQQVVGAALFAAHWNQGNGSFDIANEIAIRDFIGKEEMDQALFDKLTAGSGAVYVPSSQSPKYELVAIAVAWGPTNNRIRVSVKNEDGSDAFNVWVRHSFGGDKERFPYVGNPVEFNLGVGSHYSQPDPPPDRITVEGLASDEVDVGNANIIGFAHTEWQMTFKRTVSAPTPPPADTLEQQAVNTALSKKPWMALFEDAAIYKYAQAQKLGQPQTDEWEFDFGGTTYVGQVYSHGIAYVKKGDPQWVCHTVAKPAGT